MLKALWELKYYKGFMCRFKLCKGKMMKMKMLVGFMRNNKQPKKLAKLTASICTHHEIELIYFRPSDVDIKSNTLTGKILVGAQWKTVKRNLPSIVDISQYCFTKKNNKIIDYLRSNSYLTFDKNIPLTKEKLQLELYKDNNFQHLVIPTKKLYTSDDIFDFLQKYQVIVMKPLFGQKGKGVYILSQLKNDIFKIGYRTHEEEYTRNELVNFFQTELNDKNYILQKYIASRSKQGDPFDCRMHVQKNRINEWELVTSYIRIGIGQKVMSNVNQGGGVSDTISFLKSNFGEKWKDVYDKLIEISITLPSKIEDLKQVNLMTLGFDIAIDKLGDVYLFESNGTPTVKYIIGESALLRVEYYLYILEKQNHILR